VVPQPRRCAAPRKLGHPARNGDPGIPGRRLRFPQEDVMPYGNYFTTELLYRELTDDWSAFALW
jgi:hypothetical protein